MRALLQEKIKHLSTREDKYNALREYLQLLILRIIDEKGFFQNIAFVGGTALRILYDLRRFSEDLDFCLVQSKHYSFNKLLESISKELELQGLNVDVKGKDKKTVAAAFIRFNTLLHDLGLSSHKDQNLTVKIEVDQNPPKGYKTKLTVINKVFLMGINHYDLPSLFASKCHALLCRKYQKGRDYYDFVWYLAHNVDPNVPLLNAAIEQTEHRPSHLNKEQLKQALIEHFEKTDFERLKQDIQPFLENPAEIRFFETPYFLQLVEGWK